MQKRLKITLYIILILVIIAVIWLMFGKTNTNIETPTDTDIEISTGEEITKNNDGINNGNTINFEDDTFEADVMNDLEGFFNDNNGYEDVQGEYGFTNAEL